MRVEFDGGWANIRDPRKLPGRLSESIEDVQISLMATKAGEHLTDEAKSEEFQSLPPVQQMRIVGVEGFQAFRELMYVTVCAYVTGWEYEGVSQPPTREAFAEVPAPVTKTISDKIGEVVKATGGTTVNTEPTPDMATPSVPSSV